MGIKITAVFASLLALLLFSDLVNAQNADSLDTELEELSLEELILCEDVIEREPINPRQSFSTDQGQAYCFARLKNPGNLTKVTFRWFYENELYFVFVAKVGKSPNWRTYSSITLRKGMWRVELLDENDEQLKEIRFHCSD
jgi:hypothetical protein